MSYVSYVTRRLKGIKLYGERMKKIMSMWYGYKHHEQVQEKLKEEYIENYKNNYSQDVYILTCSFCGKDFYSYGYRALYCSYRCANDANIKRRKERKMKERQKVCPVCNEQYQAKRKDSIYCRPACRQKHFRQCNG
jgi:hypothetical protein